eukprot:CAMPEP_0201941832 /NCGR_PEP_ID=MMETSP0903-20130614/47800_1 /ASSEMBLY_ACC=CAM_ASM_000552 /TAXON_ID=420261 /ORGANISM="Thalassiosira antarctica, Strain CCMP982" /LENGTH=96 /DNA_ID=CAMNT_0048484009 /DNA_START=32 /DNA_END=318 /DNA_ORIENTATION=-
MAHQAHLIVVTMALVIASDITPSATAFVPPKSLASLSTTTALSQSNNPSLPFFAAPAFSSSSSSPASGGQVAAAGTSPQSATVTLRLPLGTLFDGR